MKFVIVNDIDKPYERHVAQVMPCGTKCRYINHTLRHWMPMGLEDATRIEEFGFTVETKKEGVIFTKTMPSTAKYKNGEERQWQGDDCFIIKPWVHDRKEPK